MPRPMEADRACVKSAIFSLGAIVWHMSSVDYVHGSCLCRSVRWRALKPFQRMSHCHCSMCRKSHGAPFATFVATAVAGFEWLQGEEQNVRYGSSGQSERCFCRQCGSSLPELAGQEGLAWLPAGGLDEDPGTRPFAHIFVGSKAPWYAIPEDGLPRYDAYTPEHNLGSVEQPSEQSSVPGWVRGSCLCGDVAFDLAVGDWTLTQCHCSRCRKGRAAAHGGNFFAQVSQLRWLRGTEQLRTYKVPEAQRFAQTFCTRCGSPQPRAAGADRYVVPAAVLNADPGIHATRHIFVASKAPWFEIFDSFPQYEAMPAG